MKLMNFSSNKSESGEIKMLDEKIKKKKNLR